MDLRPRVESSCEHVLCIVEKTLRNQRFVVAGVDFAGSPDPDESCVIRIVQNRGESVACDFAASNPLGADWGFVLGPQ